MNTIAEQVVQAVANARLRSLVKNLAVTEEKSGLLKRTSYLDMLLSEVKRTLQQHSTVTVVLMQFGKPQELVREMGEAAVAGRLHLDAQEERVGVGLHRPQRADVVGDARQVRQAFRRNGGCFPRRSESPQLPRTSRLGCLTTSGSTGSASAARGMATRWSR